MWDRSLPAPCKPEPAKRVYPELRIKAAVHFAVIRSTDRFGPCMPVIVTLQDNAVISVSLCCPAGIECAEQSAVCRPFDCGNSLPDSVIGIKLVQSFFVCNKQFVHLISGYDRFNIAWDTGKIYNNIVLKAGVRFDAREVLRKRKIRQEICGRKPRIWNFNHNSTFFTWIWHNFFTFFLYNTDKRRELRGRCGKTGCELHPRIERRDQNAEGKRSRQIPCCACSRCADGAWRYVAQPDRKRRERIGSLYEHIRSLLGYGRGPDIIRNLGIRRKRTFEFYQ